ncbi:hypothetical protein HDC36_003342 [Xanthomonas sp. JAI131]|nr:hypothetical protein [Xanthomonas sp. JAI131]
MCAVRGRGRMPLPRIPSYSRTRSAQRGGREVGCAFFWLLFFAQAKKSNSPQGESSCSCSGNSHVGAASAATGSVRKASRLKPLLQKRTRKQKQTAKQKLPPLAGHFSLLAQRKVTKRKRALPTRPPRCALRVRGCTGDSRKGHPAPAANGAHPCAPPFGFFPGPSAAAEGNPESQKPRHSNGQSNSRATAKARATATATATATAEQQPKPEQRQQQQQQQHRGATTRAMRRLERVKPVGCLIGCEKKPGNAIKRV